MSERIGPVTTTDPPILAPLHAGPLEVATERRRLGATGAHCVLLAVVYVLLGLSMLLQPHRWLIQGAYRNIFEVLPIMAWGWIFLAVAALLGVGAAGRKRGRRWLTGVGLVAGLALNISWTAAFLIRYVTSDSTSAALPVCFGAFSVMLVMAVRHRDDHPRTVRYHDGESRPGAPQ